VENVIGILCVGSFMNELWT